MADVITPSASPNSNTFNGRESLDTTMSMSRFRKSAIGDSGLIRYNGRIYEESSAELRFPESVRTFNKMSYDATINAARAVFGMFIRKTNIFAKPQEGQEKNKKAIANAEFINWQMKNLEDRSWRQVMTDVMTYDLYGFSLMEMVFEQINKGEFAGKVRVKDLAPRAQSSVYEWIWDDAGKKLIGFEQRITNVNGRFGTDDVIKKRIPIKKCLLFSYNSTKDNPEGRSPLKSCYVTWKFKCLIEDYESTGVAKDMAGMPVFGVDKDVLVKARSDSSSPEGILMSYLESAGAAMHAGEQNFLVNPIAYDNSGKPLFNFELMGISGGSKNYNSDEIIKRRQNEILMSYFADVLKLGQDGVGSFALADSKNNLLAHAVDDHLDFIIETLQRQMVKTLATLNGWEDKDIPELFADDIEDRDLDELGKYIQRVVSVGAMSVDKDLDDNLRSAGRLPKADYNKPMPDNEGNTSRSGDGMKSAGDGTSNSVGGKDNSVSNTENASVDNYNTLFTIKGWENDQVTISTATGRLLTMSWSELRTFFTG